MHRKETHRRQHGRDPGQPPFLGHKRHRDGDRVRNEQIRAFGQTREIVITFPNKGHHDASDQILGTSPGMEDPLDHFLRAPELGFQRAHHGGFDSLAFDRLAVTVKRCNQRPMAAGLQFLRDGEIRMEITQ